MINKDQILEIAQQISSRSDINFDVESVQQEYINRLRVDKNGNSVLIGLYDKNRELIITK